MHSSFFEFSDLQNKNFSIFKKENLDPNNFFENFIISDILSSNDEDNYQHEIQQTLHDFI